MFAKSKYIANINFARLSYYNICVLVVLFLSMKYGALFCECNYRPKQLFSHL